MGFFDDMSKKLAEAGNTAVAKTKEFTETTKLNSAITAEEGKIKDFYTSLGKAFYEAGNENNDERFAKYFEAIASSEELIRRYREQIRAIKGTEVCPNCGAEIESGSAFCSSCGAKLPEKPIEPVKEQLTCPNCHEPVEEGSRFCTNCGQPLEPREAQETQETAE